MSKTICLIAFLLITLVSRSQGGWSIGYIPIDSINQSHTGQMVRIDFKDPAKNRQWVDSWSVRRFVEPKDTGSLMIDSSLTMLVERRLIYVDHGSYFDQFLECVNCKSPLRIYDAEILEVDEKTILFRFEIGEGKPGKADNISKIIQVQRSDLDGVMYKL